MKFIAEDLQNFKSIITTITGLASKKIISGNEQCVLIEADEDKNIITFTALETGSHKIKLEYLATVQESGKVLILASKLKNLASKLVPKTVVIVESIDGLLKFLVKPYGSINENLYHDQSSFDSPLVNSINDFSEVTVDNDIIPMLLPFAGSFTYNGKSIYLKTSSQNFEVYTQFSETGYIKYQAPTQTNQTQTCQIYLKPNLIRIMGSLGKTSDIFYSPSERAMKFKGDQGSLTVIGDSLNFAQSNTVDKILSLPVTGQVSVNHIDLLTAVNWQGYNVDNSDSVSLIVDENNLKINCNKNNEAASIITSGSENFLPITVPLAPFQLALKALGNSKSIILPITSVLLEQRIISIGDNEIKLLSLSPEDKPDCYATCLIYENRTHR